MSSPAAMSCDTVQPLLSAFVDGEVSAVEAALVETHLSSCAGCASDVAFFRLAHATLADPHPVLPPAALSERIAAATYARPTLSQRVAAWLRPAPARLALGTACAVTIAAVIVLRGGGGDNAPTGGVPSVVRGPETVVPVPPPTVAGAEKTPGAAEKPDVPGTSPNARRIAEVTRRTISPEVLRLRGASKESGPAVRGSVALTTDASDATRRVPVGNVTGERAGRPTQGITVGKASTQSIAASTQRTGSVRTHGKTAAPSANRTEIAINVTTPKIEQTPMPVVPAADEMPTPKPVTPPQTTPEPVVVAANTVVRGLGDNGRIAITRSSETGVAAAIRHERGTAGTFQTASYSMRGDFDGGRELGQSGGGGGNFVSAPATLR
jgi:hypothetical protein